MRANRFLPSIHSAAAIRPPAVYTTRRIPRDPGERPAGDSPVALPVWGAQYAGQGWGA
jgi:hypothetical protein